MSRYVFLVLTNAKEGQDDEFNKWYTETHLPDLLELEGFVAAQRFQVIGGLNDGPLPHRYMALYEIEANELDSAKAALSDASTSGRMVVSSALDSTTVEGWYFKPIGERVVAGEVKN